jgi:hypothetical protein
VGARRIGLACFGLFLACGARTGLLSGSGGTTTSGGGTPSGPLAVACHAALADAPTPMTGYCPTRANQAAVAGPHAPQIAWATQPFGPIDPGYYLASTIVVDAAGQAYVTLDSSPLNPAADHRVAAVDPHGNLAWTQTFPNAVTDLALGRDGTLWVLGGNAIVTGLDPSDGSPVTTIGPASSEDAGTAGAYLSFALGGDGSFFVSPAQPFGSSPTLMRISSAGATLWLWGTQVDVLPVVLDADDDAFLSANGAAEIAPTGEVVWDDTFGLAPDRAGGLDTSGSFVGLGSTPGGNSTPTMLRFDALGHEQPGAALPQVTTDASAMALAGDGTTIVLLANELPGPGDTKSHVMVIALDATGSTRWTTDFDTAPGFDPGALSAHYGVFVDAAGTVVAMAGSLTGIDLASGAVLWTLQPPHPAYCLRPAVLGAGGSIVGLQCDGTVFLARDP